MIHRSRATILRKTETPDGLGSYDTAWPPIATGVPCTVQVLSGRELLAYGSVYAQATHRIFVTRVTRGRSPANNEPLAHATDVNTKDRLVIDGVTYYVEAVNDPKIRGRHKTLICRTEAPSD